VSRLLIITRTIAGHNKERINLVGQEWHQLSLDIKMIYVQDQNKYAKLPFVDNAFDIARNFEALWFIADLIDFLRKLTRVSSKLVIICVLNSSNIFYMLQMVSQKSSDTIYTDNINPSKISGIMEKLDRQVEEHVYLDIPPWPDIGMKKEELLKNVS
jgi:ubiquinone/menaquinone biosynthesis C-methylase UbiE